MVTCLLIRFYQVKQQLAMVSYVMLDFFSIVLYDACNILATQMNDEEKFPPVKREVINPESISINELFRYFDNTITPQWHDGILSTVLKRICQDTRNITQWLILDGPVDTLGIERMNSVLDDNKVLALNNDDRIALVIRLGYCLKLRI